MRSWIPCVIPHTFIMPISLAQYIFLAASIMVFTWLLSIEVWTTSPYILTLPILPHTFMISFLHFTVTFSVTGTHLQIFVEPEKQNCLAMLVFVSMLWATEAIELYATSMLVAPLCVILRVMVSLPNLYSNSVPRQRCPRC